LKPIVQVNEYSELNAGHPLYQKIAEGIGVSGQFDGAKRWIEAGSKLDSLAPNISSINFRGFSLSQDLSLPQTIWSP
jgi:hypothetical protein